MPSAHDVEELAAVVADGRPFDWADAGPLDHRPLHGLWRAVRQRDGGRAPRTATRARLSTPLVWLTIVTLAKSAITALAAALALDAVNVLQLVSIASFSAVGVALVYGGHRDLRARHLGVVLLLLGSVMTNPILRQVTETRPDAPSFLFLLRGLVVESLLPAAMWLFVGGFPQAVWSPRDAAWLRRGLRWSTALGVVLVVANALYWAGARWPGLEALNRNALVTVYYWRLVALATAAALAFMLWRRRDAAADERAKVTALMTGMVASLLPSAVVILLRFTQARAWMLAHFDLTFAVMYSGLVALPVFTAYAVVAHRVLRVDLVLRAAARYALARGLLLSFTAGPLVMLAVYGYQRRHLPVGDLFNSSTGRSLLAVSAIGALLLAARLRLQSLVDRAFRRDTVSLASALDVFARRSGEGLGLGDVVEATQRSIAAAFHPEIVAVLVADRTHDAFVPLGAPLPPLSRSTLLAQALAGVRDPVAVDLEDPDSVARLLPRPDQDWLADAGIVVLTPLVASGGTVCGLIALGPMTGGRTYTDGDLRYLGALANAAAPAIESRLLRTVSASRALDDVAWDDESGRECPACGQSVAASVNTCPTCGRPTVPMGIPQHLHGKFTVLRRLGAGGMGVAYLAQDDALGRRVALKTLPRVRPEAVEQLRREARAMAQVSHPALATIHGLESWRAVPVLVVEYLPGGTLADRLREGPMSEPDVVVMARHVLGGLRRLHQAGLLHRDLKPSNIGFSADGTPKVLDFGLSRLRHRVVDETAASGSTTDGVSSDGEMANDITSLAGTPAYLSPELVAGDAPSPADDLWALAVVMVEALQGVHPWAGESVAAVLARLRAGEVPGFRSGRDALSQGARTFLSRALSRECCARPQVHEFEEELMLLGQFRASTQEGPTDE